mgnify:CR=1 FL=1|jgi:hypothetical protein
MYFSLAQCKGYVAPEPTHRLSRQPALSGLKWHQRGTQLGGRTLVSQCSVFEGGQRCRRSTTFDYRYCHRHLAEFYSLGVFPTSVPGLKGYGLYAINPAELARLGLDAERRPVQNRDLVVFRPNEAIGGRECVFVGEALSDREGDRRYPYPLGGDYVIGDDHGTIDGQVARTVLQFSNDAINLKDAQRRRNLPDQVCMPEWPVVQNAEGVAFGPTDTGLVAIDDIFHGQEVFWSYSGDGADPDGDYWSAPNHQ